MSRDGQKWILDVMLGLGGYEVLHRDCINWQEVKGYNHTDLELVFSQVKSRAMIPKAWANRALEVERIARTMEERGFSLAARDMYARATLLYGRARYAFFQDDPRKMAYHRKTLKCFEKYQEFNLTPIERVVLPFEDKNIYGILHLPDNGGGKFPALILIPGMDMFKEDWTHAVQTYFLKKGFAVLAIDGPGQGESLIHGLKASIDNYEEAASRFVDYLVARDEIDQDKIVAAGVSMGSYWGTRFAATEPRLKACATALGCYGEKEIIFNQAQPSFRNNFMYMAGIEDEAEFEEYKEQMVLDELMGDIDCPFLMVHGEFDELTPLEDVLKIYQKVNSPKEMWVYENQFHTLGQVAEDFMAALGDWLLQRVETEIPPLNKVLYCAKNGVISEQDEPDWWQPTYLE